MVDVVAEEEEVVEVEVMIAGAAVVVATVIVVSRTVQGMQEWLGDLKIQIVIIIGSLKNF